MKPRHTFEVGEEEGRALGLKNEPGWTGSFSRAEAEGALRNGTRVRKLIMEEGDTHPVCAPGTVLGSLAVPAELSRGQRHQVRFFYYVEWDMSPKEACAVMDYKIVDATPLPPYRARFNPNDAALIEAAWKSKTLGPHARRHHRHVFLAIAQAVRCFHWRLFDLFPNGLPINEETGEMMLSVCKPATFFDDFCMKLVIEDLCNATGRGLARMMSPNTEGKGTPDVIFV